jgi:hypothetical protein
MSSNAAAIRRRAGVQPTGPPATNTPQSTTTASSQMTLQQVISTVDKRLVQLEQIVGDAKIENNENNDNDLTNIVSEFNNRFELIVTEINSLKDVVLKLQTFTMDVNKRLFDERIQVLSDIESNTTLHIDNTELQGNNTVNLESELNSN